MKIGMKIGAGFCAMLVLTIILGGISLYSMLLGSDSAEEIADDRMPRFIEWGHTQNDLLESAYYARAFFEGGDEKNMEKSRALLQNIGKRWSCPYLNGHFFKKFLRPPGKFPRAAFARLLPLRFKNARPGPAGAYAALHFFLYATFETRAAPGKFPSESALLLNCLGDSHFSPLCGACSL